MGDQEPSATSSEPKPMPPPKLSAFKRLLKALHLDFLSWLEDKFVKNTFRWFLVEIRGVKKGWVLFLVFLICTCSILWHEVSEWDEGNFSDEKVGMTNAVTIADQERDAAVKDRDKYQILYNQDENSSAELR